MYKHYGILLVLVISFINLSSEILISKNDQETNVNIIDGIVVAPHSMPYMVGNRSINIYLEHNLGIFQHAKKTIPGIFLEYLVLTEDISPWSILKRITQYMVAIRTIIDGISVLCGGSLISDSLVLTSAKCVYGAAEAEVILGAHDIEKEDEEGQISTTSSSFIIHEQYVPSSLLHDIAIIQLKEAVSLSDKISTIKLPEVTDILDTYDEQEATVAGWGRINDTVQVYSNELRYQNLTIIPVLVCDLSYVFQIQPTQLCTSGVSRKNICLGDSGSPLVLNGVQIGIASYGSELGCSLGFPGVYTRVTSYLSWLML